MAEDNFPVYELRLPSGKKVRFDAPVAQTLTFEGAIVVRLDSLLGQNVFGISEDGDILWQAEATETHAGRTPYNEIWKQDNNAILANVDRYLVIVPQSGMVIRRYSEK